jgi:hypothetical protein
MFGCLRRVGCLLLILILAGGAYYWWTVKVTRPGGTTTSGVWQPVTPADAAAGARGVASLQASTGKVFTNLTPAQAVAYLIEETSKQLPSSATDVQAMVSGDQLHVRAVLPLQELGGAKALGPLANMLGARDTVELAGRVDLLRAGMAQMHITKARVGSLNLPAAMIPRVVSQIRRESPPGIAADALALPLPPYIGDVRIANGKVTLYKNVS